MSPRPEHVLARRRARGGAPLVLAHRGDHRALPENTMGAFRAALAGGADGLELDVRVCRTGEVVVSHDPSLFRVAGVPLEVAKHRLADLRAVDLGSGERVPTLDEVLDLVAEGDGRVVNVEVKGDVPDRIGAARAVAAVLGRRGAQAATAVVVSTFDPLVCVALRVARCPAPVAFLYDGEHTGPRRARVLARSLPIDAIHPHHALATAETIARAARAGLFVCAWTVNDGAVARRLAREGVDAIITDEAARVRLALDDARR